MRRLKLLLLSKEHAKANNRPVNQQSANNTHDHGLDSYLIAMGQDDG